VPAHPVQVRQLRRQRAAARRALLKQPDRRGRLYPRGNAVQLALHWARLPLPRRAPARPAVPSRRGLGVHVCRVAGLATARARGAVATAGRQVIQAVGRGLHQEGQGERGLLDGRARGQRRQRRRAAGQAQLQIAPGAQRLRAGSPARRDDESMGKC